MHQFRSKGKRETVTLGVCCEYVWGGSEGTLWMCYIINREDVDGYVSIAVIGTM